jgi:hypothetical protein
MTYDRSADDLPLAAYGGSGMELTAEDEARIDLAAAAAAEHDAEGLAAGATSGSGASGISAAAEAEPGLDLADEPGAQAGMPLGTGLLGLASQLVTLLRTSRLAAGAAFGGVILVGLLLLAGGGPTPGSANAPASLPPAPAAIATHEPGSATLVLTGKLNQTLAFAGMSGTGAPGAPIAATWTSTGAETLGIEGAPDRGTRSTDESLVLRFTVTVKNRPVTFTSDAGECTIGMAVNPTNVSGTFVCTSLKSDDGKLVVGATGTYRT